MAFLFSKITWMGLALGQFVSILIATTSYCSAKLAEKGIEAPTSQSFLNYTLLAVVYGSVMIYRRIRKPKPLEAKWYYYLMLGLVDVEANFLVVKAYQYTNINSAMLLDVWVVPCVVILSLIFLKMRYKIKEYIGMAICIAGAVIIVFSDAIGDFGKAAVKGDFLVIAGVSLYAVSNVSEEILVKRGSRVELMAFLGLFGAIISAIQIAILERKELRSINWSTDAVMPFVGFTLAMFFFYSSVPTLLKITSALMLNLSLLTSDMWGVVLQIYALKKKVDWLYFVAFAFVTVGLAVYSKTKREEVETRGQVANPNGDATQTGAVDQEAGSGHSGLDSNKDVGKDEHTTPSKDFGKGEEQAEASPSSNLP